VNESLYQSPKIKSIFLGILLFVILMVVFSLIGDLVKATGYVFMFLPDKAGLVRQVKGEEINLLERDKRLSFVALQQPGYYFLYTDDLDLLEMADQISGVKSEPWLSVIEQSSGRRVSVEFVTRGLQIYDTPLAKGRPVFRFEIKTPGRYQFNHPARQANLALVPDYITGNEEVILFFIVLQVLIIGIPLGRFALKRYQRGLSSEQANLKENRERLEAQIRMQKKRMESRGKNGGNN
jgi:hypothetical protein